MTYTQFHVVYGIDCTVYPNVTDPFAAFRAEIDQLAEDGSYFSDARKPVATLAKSETPMSIYLGWELATFTPHQRPLPVSKIIHATVPSKGDLDMFDDRYGGLMEDPGVSAGLKQALASAERSIFVIWEE